MVDVTDLARANMLQSELDQIEQAIDLFHVDGSRIINMTIATPLDDFPGRQLTIGTAYITPPPQMMEAIITALHDREEHIASELSGMGVTGVETQPRR